MDYATPRHSAQQRNKPAAAVNFEFAEDRVEVLFHHRQTQAGVISDLLVTPPFTDKPRNFLFAPCESGEVRQTDACLPGMHSSGRAQILALDEEMRPRHADRTQLFQMECRSQMRRSWMTDAFFFEAYLRRNGALRVRPLLFEQTASIQNLGRNR